MATPVPQKDDVENWTVEQVAAWLQQVQLSECCDTFLRKGIDGHKFLQLSEEDLFLWGRDVSIRNRKQILKLVSQIKNLQQHPSTTRPSIDIFQSNDSQLHTTNNDDHGEDTDDFTSDEEDEEEDCSVEAQPPQDENVEDCHLPVRAPLPTPRNQGIQYEDDLYVIPIEACSKPDFSSMQRRLPGFEQPKLPLPSSSKNVPWNSGRRIIGTDSQSPKPPGERGPAPLPHQLTSQSKMPSETSAPSPPPPPKPRVNNRRLFPGSNSGKIVGSENARGGASFLHRELQENKPSTFSKIPWNNGPAWKPPSAQGNNDHVYEPVDNPMASYGASETPTSNVPDWKPPGRPPVPPLWKQTQAPVLLVRGMRRRFAHWIVIHHQRYLQKLSVRRRRRQSLGNRPPRPCSEPLVLNESHRIHRKVRPRSEPPSSGSVLEYSEETHTADEVELEVHVSVIHVPVQPLLVLSNSFSWARLPRLPLIHRLSDFDDQGLSSRLGAAAISHKTQQGLSRKKSDEGNDTGLVQSSTSGPQRHIGSHRPPQPISISHRRETPQESQAPQEIAPLLPSENQPYVKLDDGEIILITPLYQKIMELPYFHMISRGKAKALMMNGEDGVFLIRPSTRTGNPFTLTLKQDNHTYNINIRQRPDSLFALGAEKAQEQTFSSISEMIRTYSREPIKLKNGRSAILKLTPPKQGSIYVKHHPPGPGKKY